MKSRLVIIVILVLITFKSKAQDNLKSPLNYSAFISGDLTSTGFYGGIGAQIRKEKIEFSIAYLIDYSKANTSINGPFGVGLCANYYPTNKSKVNQFITTDYRLILSKRSCTYDCTVNYNKTHEFSLGYGISIIIFKQLSIANSINAGLYSKSLFSDRTGNTISERGMTTLIKTRLNFHF